MARRRQRSASSYSPARQRALPRLASKHRRVIGRQAQPLAVAGHRLVVTAQHCQCVAQIRQRRRVAGMDRQGPAASTGGILVPSHTALDHAQQRPDLSVAGVLRAGLS